MWRLAQDTSNVVRCSAVEGLGELVLRAPSQRHHVEEFLRNTVRTGTPAMKTRAAHALKKLERR